MALPPHVPLAMKLMPHLVECAKEKRRTTYEEMSKATGIDARLFSRPLMFIRDHVCAGHNLPPLTVLVQRKGSITSSTSFDPIQFATLNIKAYQTVEAEMLEKVYEYEKWERALSGAKEFYGQVT